MVGSRIYFQQMPEAALASATPVIVFFKVLSIPIESLSGDNSTEAARYQFDCYSTYPDYYKAVDLSRAVRSLLVPKSDGSGTTPSNPYTLPDGTLVLAAQLHDDRDFPPDDAISARFCRRLLEIKFTYVPA